MIQSQETPTRRHANIHVIGSLDFVQTLFAERLFDRLTLWVYPILLGSAKKVFADGVVPTNLRLIEPVVASPKCAVLQRYALADGTPGVGDMSASDQAGQVEAAFHDVGRNTPWAPSRE
ncbi:dihydrofolate reductase family protein [Arthrobacter sp. Soil762]|uniref:dihydrofolate reductase family protein n=1 Tax=Arthrobacter sp. Soil762 TaxID=1736401 RepID=UPI000AEEB4B2